MFKRPLGRYAAITSLGLLCACALLALPFFVLIRIALYLSMGCGLHGWLAIAFGAGLASVVLLAYAAWLRRRFRGSWRTSRRTVAVLVLLVACYSTYALVTLPSANLKSPELRAFHSGVHPVLRVALSTLILVDENLVITDTRRELRDYRSMGLTANERSRHLVQPDGYVHAVDLRTAGRPGFRNAVVRGYFVIMGFWTLRHVGTADHLHVSLPLGSEIRSTQQRVPQGSDAGGVGAHVALAVAGLGADVDHGSVGVGADADDHVVDEVEDA